VLQELEQLRVQKLRRNKMTEQEIKTEEKKAEQVDKLEAKVENNSESAGAQPKEEKKEQKKEKSPVKKKEEAFCRGDGVHASKKHCMYISEFIKGKSIDQAIAELNQVINFKRAVPFKGEIPHRRGKGMMSGRYPINASKIFIMLLKGLKGNVIANGMDLDKTRIVSSSSNWASRPMRRGGVHAKRTHILIKAKEVSK